MKTINNLDALISERYSKPMSLPFELNETLAATFTSALMVVDVRYTADVRPPESASELKDDGDDVL